MECEGRLRRDAISSRYALEVQRRPAMKKRNSSQQGQKRTMKGKRSQESVTMLVDGMVVFREERAPEFVRR